MTNQEKAIEWFKTNSPYDQYVKRGEDGNTIYKQWSDGDWYQRIIYNESVIHEYNYFQPFILSCNVGFMNIIIKNI